jgi:GDP-L-fucose synthase
MNKIDKIYVAGHRGMVGGAILAELQRQGFTNIITRTSSELDLRNQLQVREFFSLNDLNMYFLRQQKLAAFWLIALTAPNLFMTI